MHEFGDLSLLLFDNGQQIIRAGCHLLDVFLVGGCCNGDVTELLGELLIVFRGSWLFDHVCCTFKSVVAARCLFILFGVGVEVAKIDL